MYVKLFFILWAVLLVLDLAWVLTNVKVGVYRGYINGVVSSYPMIILLWLCVSGLLALCIMAGFKYLPKKKVVYGAMILGLTVYFIFNATSLIMFSWSAWRAVVDTTWGTVLCGIAAIIGLAVLPKLSAPMDPSILHPASIRV
jgi:uncharacterized membrane protein